MMTFQRITQTDSPLYNYAEQLLQASFPKEEYRDLEELKYFIENKPCFHFNVIERDGTPVGLMTYWIFDTFCYAEHFAIDPAQRNGGYGREAMALLCGMLPLPLVLEVEAPETELAQRRINFYKRQGLVLWDNPYRQPPYRPGYPFLPMHLMAYGSLNSATDFEHIRQTIYREVYQAEKVCDVITNPSHTYF